MRHDGALSGTRLENKTKASPLGAYFENNSSFQRIVPLSAVSGPFRGVNRSSASNTTVPKGFYSSYNPEVGIHTATVLGGILSFLVVYVIYRTKCRKRLLEAFQSCAMRFLPEEYAPEESRSFQDRSRVQDASVWNQSPRHVWRDDSDGANCDNKSTCMIRVTCPSSGENDKCAHVHLEQGSDVIPDGGLVHSYDIPLELPDVEEDSEQATAHWVQNVKEMDPKEQHLSGIILKIPPDLVHKSYRTRCNFLSASDYSDCDGLINISSRNKSLPLLLESQRGHAQYTFTHAKTKEAGSDDLPCLSPESQDSDPRPTQLHVQHQSGAKVPLDICPIIKIQHYHSRSRRRLTSLCRTSSEESLSSDSSDEPLLVRKQPDSNSANQTHAKHSNNVKSGGLSCGEMTEGQNIPHLGCVNSIAGNLETSL